MERDLKDSFGAEEDSMQNLFSENYYVITLIWWKKE